MCVPANGESQWSTTAVYTPQNIEKKYAVNANNNCWSLTVIDSGEKSVQHWRHKSVTKNVRAPKYVAD